MYKIIKIVKDFLLSIKRKKEVIKIIPKHSTLYLPPEVEGRIQNSSIPHLVHLDGILLLPDRDYFINNNTIIFSFDIESSSHIVIKYIDHINNWQSCLLDVNV